MEGSLISVKDVAEQMASQEDDIERLIIQYPVELPGKVSTATVDKILIPRERQNGDLLYTLTPPEHTKTLIQRHTGQDLMRRQHAISSENLHIYQSMKIPEVDGEVVTGFAKLVETCYSGNRKATCDFVHSSLTVLAARAADIQFESWNSAEDRESCALGTRLQQSLKNFPPQFPPTSHDPHDPHDPPSTSINSGGQDISVTEARQSMFKRTLARLLTLIHACKSSLSNDTRIWQLVAQLLVLWCSRPRTEFALKMGVLVLKGSVMLMTKRGGSSGGGARGGPLDLGPSLGPRPQGFPWGKAIAFAGLSAVALVPGCQGFLIGSLAALAGFGAQGIVAGSLAAGWQASIGVIEAGSLFAMLQGIGMAGAASAAGAPLLATVGAVAGVGATLLGEGIVSERTQDRASPDKVTMVVKVVLLVL
ncbi:hypothetical protein BDZ91DRAFT_750600 [Kalaharituber pfeilii]|nr:hypothetical protein BDZ91DRAFT_750600 [Kalaharituber pfeilii]